jgi:hypothetical protein
LWRFSVRSTGSGSTKIVTSVRILPAALMYQNGRFGMQVPFSSGCQNLGMGWQLKMVMRSCDRVQHPMKTPAITMAFCMRPTSNIRWYWRRNVIFTEVRAALYRTMDT